MREKLTIQRLATSSIALLLASVAGTAAADEPDAVVGNPNFNANPAPVVIDLSPDAPEGDRPTFAEYPDNPVVFGDLDHYRLQADPQPDTARTREALPDGMTQFGGMVFPEAMLDGAIMVGDAAAALLPPSDPSAGDPQEICAFPDDVPSGVYEHEPRPGQESPRFHTVYLNYLGGEMNRGGENSAENMSNIAQSNSTYPVYGGGEEKAIAVAQAVAADFEDWAVRVVYADRPPKLLPYTMVMIGGSYTDTTSGPSGGVAPLDCEDFGQRNVCYAFQNQSPATTQANVASQEIGHTLGLGHTQATDSVMAFGYSATQPGDLGLNDSCSPTINLQGQGASCIGVNKCHCGTGDAQHDKRTLFATFSPAGPDITPPTIELLQPEDESVYAPGEAVHIEFDPWDDVGGYGWKLVITNLDTGEVLSDQADYDRALLFDIVGLEEGEYELTAVIQDHADQTDEHSVTIRVEVPSEGDSGGSDDGLDGGSDGDGDSGDDDGSVSGAGTGDDAGFGEDGDDSGTGSSDDGCNCTSGDTPTQPGVLLGVFALLGLVRRRR